MDQSRFSRWIPLTMLPIAVTSIKLYSTIPLGNTLIWWGVQALVLLVFFLDVRYSRRQLEDSSLIRSLKWYLLWNVFSIIRGVFVAEIYWDYKGLADVGMALLIPVIAYLALDKEKVQDILSFYLKYVLLLLVFFIPFLPTGAWGWYLFPISFLMIFFPALPLKGKALVLIVTLIAIFIDLGARSHAIKYSMPIVLLLAFYTIRKFPMSIKIMRFVRAAFLIAPFVFLFLAVTGTFEIFKMDQYIEGDYVETSVNRQGEVEEEDLTADTRTGLYEEVIVSALKNDYWLIGRSPARGNDTKLFESLEETTGRKERLANEVAVLNVFTWTGVVGVVLFFLVFYQSSFLAINRSNNIYVKMVGVFIAFRWFYAWVEDYNGFNMNNLVIWMMIGVCFSSSFRKMSDSEVKLWVWGIFSKKYYLVYRKYILSKSA
ncbi:hypothetical protein [Sunxiuqinia indica]|uniref:hypothetical protein n=1 Tax=Sunxiuqinia indica TaxID=2692584 RepID=UPI001359033F|nr:hypothetical protein [Sunxiuqinia indica]